MAEVLCAQPSCDTPMAAKLTRTEHGVCTETLPPSLPHLQTISFASKLTRLETKFYRKLQGKSKEEKERKKERQRSTSGTEAS